MQYLVPVHEASTREILVMQKALDEDQGSILELALLMKSRGNFDAYEYWLEQASEEISDPLPETVIVPTVQAIAQEETVIASTVQEAAQEDNPLPPTLVEAKLQKSTSTFNISDQVQPLKDSTERTLTTDDANPNPLSPLNKPCPNPQLNWILQNFNIEDGIITQKHAINLVQLSVLPFCSLLAVLYSKFDSTFITYIALHSTFAISWFFVTTMFSLNTLDRVLISNEAYESVLCLYTFFLSPLLICVNNVQLSNLFLTFLAATSFIGNFIVTGSIIQKSCMPDKLLTTGFFKNVRNPTVFGNILVYTSLGLMSWSVLGLVPLVSFILFVWIPAIKFKEEGLAAKFTQQWVVYRKSTKWLIPYFY
jgi:protein-S-isoprenylcysteine O-methyltransferase Ste14